MIDINAMFPVIVTDKINILKTFYEVTFGFKTVFFEKDFYLHLISANDKVELGFLIPKHKSQPEFLHRNMSIKGFAISLEVNDAALAYQKALTMNLSIVVPLKEEVWGQIHFIIEDPAGFHVDVVQHLS